LILISPGELRHQVHVRGWDQRILAREAGVSEATVSRVLAGHPVRGLTALRMVQALRRNPAIPELAELVVKAASRGPRGV
jgi:plasmid maintenance system antidote protein VapI